MCRARVRMSPASASAGIARDPAVRHEPAHKAVLLHVQVEMDIVVERIIFFLREFQLIFRPDAQITARGGQEADQSGKKSLA